MTTLELDEECTIKTSIGSRTMLPAEVAHLMEAQTPSDGSVEGTEEVGVEEEVPVANSLILP
jgi:hypothetical protein